MLLPTKSCPRLRGKCRGVAVTKGERLEDAKCREMFPLSLTSFASSPAGEPVGYIQTLTLMLFLIPNPKQP